ncbi:protocadherin-15 isoform X1 [Tachysurus ichikawai]
MRWIVSRESGTVKPHRWCTFISETCTMPTLVRNMNQPGVSLDKSTAHAEDKEKGHTLLFPFPTVSLTAVFPYEDWQYEDCKLSRTGPPATIVAIDEESPNGRYRSCLFCTNKALQFAGAIPSRHSML